MLIQVVLPDRKRYTMRVEQVVGYTDEGFPVLIAYQSGEHVICHDVGHRDFEEATNRLKITRLDT